MSAPLGDSSDGFTTGRHPVAAFRVTSQSPNGLFGLVITPPGPHLRFFANNHGMYSPHERNPLKLFPPPDGIGAKIVFPRSPLQSCAERVRFTGPVTPDASFTY